MNTSSVSNWNSFGNRTAWLRLFITVRDFLARARMKWLSLGVGFAVLATFPLRVAIGNSAAWRAFAAWLVDRS